MCVRTVCVKVEQKNTKLKIRDGSNDCLSSEMAQMIAYHQNFVDEEKLVGGGASVACIVRSVSPLANIYGFWHHVRILPAQHLQLN